MDSEELGRWMAEFETDNRRRRRVALVFLLVAVVGLGAGIPLSIDFFARSAEPLDAGESPGPLPGLLPSAVTMTGVVALCFGSALWAAAARRRDEVFALHERGFVHRSRGAAAVVSWPDVESVRARGQETTGGPHHLGVDFTCVVRLTDGKKITFNTYTTDAVRLAASIEAAVNDGRSPGTR